MQPSICGAALASALAVVPPVSGHARSEGAPFVVSGAACSLGKADPDGIKRLYWELHDLSELCIEVDVVTTPPTKMSLSLVLVYQGREISGLPVSTLARAHTNTTTGLVEPTFDLHTPRGALVLIAPQRDYQLTYPCDQSQGGCPFNGVVASLRPSELLELSEAKSLEGHALGADFTVTPVGLEAIRTLAAVVRQERQPIVNGGVLGLARSRQRATNSNRAESRQVADPDNPCFEWAA